MFAKVYLLKIPVAVLIILQSLTSSDFCIVRLEFLLSVMYLIQ